MAAGISPPLVDLILLRGWELYFVHLDTSHRLTWTLPKRGRIKICSTELAPSKTVRSVKDLKEKKESKKDLKGEIITPVTKYLHGARSNPSA